MTTSKFSDNRKLIVIQFFGGPGVGKSTVAPKLFALMKEHGMAVEFAHEIAKDLVYESADHMFSEQDWILAHQHRLLRRLVRHDVDYVVTDSSILLGLFYMKEDYPQSLKPFIRDVFDSYTNINIVLTRNPDIPYQQQGRNQDEEEAIELDKRIMQYLNDEKIPYHSVMAGKSAAQEIFDYLFKEPQFETELPPTPEVIQIMESVENASRKLRERWAVEEVQALPIDLEAELMNVLHEEIVRETLREINPDITDAEIVLWAKKCPNPWDAKILYLMTNLNLSLSEASRIERIQ